MTIEFGRGKDKQKRKQRRKEIFGAIREQGRKDARTGEGASRQRESLEGSLRGNAAYAAGRADVAVNRAKKKYGEVKTSLGERGAAALGKAKDFMGKAKSAASELTGKAKSAVSSGYSAVKEKAQDLLRKRKGGSAESYARAIEALEFEVAKQVGILEFASGRNYIEFARTPGSRDKTKRKRKGMSTAAKIGLGVAGAAGVAAAARYGGASLSKRLANNALYNAPYKSGKKFDSLVKRAKGMGGRDLLRSDINAVKSGVGSGINAAKNTGKKIGERVGNARDTYKLDRNTGGGRRQALGSAWRALRNKPSK